MRISAFGNWRSNVPDQGDLAFRQFCDEVLLNGVQPFDPPTGDPEEDKKHTPAFSPTEYPPGLTRAKANVIAVSMAGFDFDALSPDATAQVLEAVSACEHVVYSTYRHGMKHRADGTYSFRVVVPLDKPVPGSEWEGFWRRLQGILPVPSDPSCKDPSRIYGLPYTPREDLSFAFFEYAPGAPISVDAVMALPDPEPTRAASSGLLSDELPPALVKSFGTALQRRVNPTEVQTGIWLHHLAAGAPWSREQGQRHQAMLQTTIALERKFPLASIPALTAIWEKSVIAISAEDPTWDPQARLQDIARAYEGARRDRIHFLQKKRAELEEARSVAIREARGDGQVQPYTDEEKAKLREYAGLVPGAPLDKHWVRVYDRDHYVLTLTGYIGPFGKNTVLLACRDRLAPAGIDTVQQNEEGKRVPIPYDSFMQRHATPVVDVMFNATKREGFVEDSVLNEPVCVPREIAPIFDPLVEEYLTKLGGTRADKLKDWIATVPELDRQTTVLYLKGPKGIGKTLIAEMLASMWGRTAPCELREILGGTFKGELKRTPICFADEVVDSQNIKIKSTTIRAHTGRNALSFNHKHKNPTTFIGCPRFIISANNDRAIMFDEQNDAADVDAADERILYIESGEGVAEWIGAHGGRALTANWVAGAFESHVMWMNQNREIDRSGRWLVPGDAGPLRNVLATAGADMPRLCEWIARYLSDDRLRKLADRVSPSCVSVEKGSVFVRKDGVADAWSTVLGDGIKPPHDLPKALRAVCSGRSPVDKTYTKGLGKSHANFWHVDMDLVRTWARENDCGDAKALETLVRAPAEWLTPA